MIHQFKIILLTIALVANLLCLGQQVQLLSSGTNSSLRGLSVVDDRVIWVSGSNGTVGRSVDRGNSFKWVIVKGFEKTDFRDIEAFDEKSAVIMGIAEPAYILKTQDGGASWQLAYENKGKGMFLDAMEFFDSKNGIVIGDPIDGKFFMARSFDGGSSWVDVPRQNLPSADSGEACFASSGTNIRKLGKQQTVFITGGLHSNIFMNNKKRAIPIIQGKETTGANSVAVKDKQTLIVAGGDFGTKDSVTNNCFITKDAGKTWKAPQTSPHGYRSCVEYIDKRNWISCGLNGVDFSDDEGNHWKWISKESFHVCRKAKNSKAVFLAGGGGRIGKLIMQ
ncbi:MAG: oxidoreductase [Ferruginibacter sp.]|nr:oxidoreductase [Ferruginibacter sp.]